MESSCVVFPKPQHMRLSSPGGSFEIDPQTRICTNEASVGELLKEYLTDKLGFELAMEEENHEAITSNRICLQLDPESNDNNEGYRLEVMTNCVRLQAPTFQGLVHGLQTIRQLLPPSLSDKEKAWSIPCLTIVDAPRFSWRGLHLDVGRHLFPVDFIKRYIDIMAFYKFNIFHWHLTEDQGWRIEIKAHPKLTEISAFRDETPILSDRNLGDGKAYGGFYTQDEIKEIVAHAKRQCITIVPEIELPGHTLAVLAAYPELGCQGEGGNYRVRTSWGVSDEVFCAGKEAVFTFLEDVLNEVLELFPSTYIHIGGDECPKLRWKTCPLCQERIKQEKLAGEAELQSWFIRRVEKWLKQRNRRLVGWDEILEGGLSKSATVMSWRGSEGGIAAAKAGNSVVMTPNTYCYLDYYQSEDKATEPPAIGGYLPLEQVYNFVVIPEELPRDKINCILGGQGNVWTEYIPSPRQVEYMAYPRAIAISEILWNHPRIRSFDDFKRRLQLHLPHMDALGINYRPL